MLPSTFLCNHLGFSHEQLLLYSRTCPKRYKRYNIPKRNGGHRAIAQPSKNLKIIQKLLLNEYFVKKMPVHTNAKAYKAKHSILDNAKPHLDNRYLLKLDFSNFFPSIKDTDFMAYIIQNEIIPSSETEELELISNIFFMRHLDELVLSIGAPSSPFISNAIMFEFDKSISKKATDRNIAYTRYSDDLTFSTNTKDILFQWPDIVKQELVDMAFPRLSLNSNKTVFSSMKHNRHITGITISNDGEASLGRTRKREIRSKIFNLENTQASKKEIESLKGLLAFVNVIEPQFIIKLREKYPEQIQIIFQN